ncbi:hypothetical protein Leryth_010542 [Lithospermum erythrorhizon]|nr:hypothetical protein Leryth_010542 [Lithospermum erythrorhizon]
MGGIKLMSEKCSYIYRLNAQSSNLFSYHRSLPILVSVVHFSQGRYGKAGGVHEAAANCCQCCSCWLQGHNLLVV